MTRGATFAIYRGDPLLLMLGAALVSCSLGTSDAAGGTGDVESRGVGSTEKKN